MAHGVGVARPALGMTTRKRTELLRLFLPVVRVGRVCAIDERLNLSRSREVALRVQEDWRTYRDASSRSWEQCGRDIHIDWPKGQPVTITEDAHRAPVVRFPRFGVNWGTDRYASKMDITVCAHGRSSKVFALVGLEKRKGRVDTLLSTSDVRDLFTRMTDVGMRVTSRVADHYGRLLRRHQQDRSFRKAYLIIVRVANSVDARVGEIMEGLRVNDFGDMEEVLQRTSHRATLEAFLGTVGRDLRGAERAMASGNARWQLHPAASYDVLYFAEVKSDRIEYTGLAYSSYEQPGDFPSWEDLPAVGSTGIVAADIGPAY
jgi:hypothetical protein